MPDGLESFIQRIRINNHVWFAAIWINNANLYCDKDQACTIYCYEYGCANISSETGNGTYIRVCVFNIAINIFCNQSSDVMIGYPINIDFDNSLPFELIQVLLTTVSDAMQNNLNLVGVIVWLYGLF